MKFKTIEDIQKAVERVMLDNPVLQTSGDEYLTVNLDINVETATEILRSISIRVRIDSDDTAEE